jgi:LPS sulfotransferase NodH
MCKPFVILHTARCGSHYLASLLNNHPNIKCLGEILNNRMLQEKDCRQWNEILEDLTNSRKQIGFLLPVGILPYIEKEITEWVKEVPEKILLFRKNDLERFLSYKLSLENNVWIETDIPKNYEKKKVKFYMKEFLMQAVEQQRRIMLGENLNPTLKISYEELTNSVSESLTKILTILGQENKEITINKTTTKQNPEKPKDKITNPEDLETPEMLHALKNLNKTIRIIPFEPGKFQKILQEGVKYMQEDLKAFWKTPLMDLEWNNPPKSDGSNWDEILSIPLKEVIIEEPSGKLRKISLGKPEHLLLKYVAVLLLKRMGTNYSITSQHGPFLYKDPNLVLSNITNDIPSEWEEAEGYKMDIKSCFSSIEPSAVIKAIDTKLKNLTPEEKEGMKLLKKIFQYSRTTTTQSGIVTGDPTGIFWANAVLEGIDKILCNNKVNFIRIVDDISIDTSEYNKAVLAIIEISSWLKENGLQANLDKTGFVNDEID